MRGWVIRALLTAAAVGVGCGDDEAGGTGVATGASSGLTTASGGPDPATSTSMGSATGSESTSGSTGGEDSTTGPGESTSSSSSGESTSSSTGGDSSSGTTGTIEPPHPLWVSPNLWYSTEDRLNYIEIDPADGTVVQMVTSTITTPLVSGQTGITMLESGGLLLSRESAEGTEIYYVEDPPTTATDIEVEVLGTVPDTLRIEALYTDCEGLVYLMDTGSDVTSAEGNRLIRFTEDYLAGDLSYEVITDLSMASAPDIDDLGPGLDEDGELTDGRGFAIDTGTVYDFDYNTGTGTQLGTAGTFGVHVLGGPLFDDATPRLYVFNIDAELFEADPLTLAVSDVLVTGPKATGNLSAGSSGITGPLTECVTTLPPPG